MTGDFSAVGPLRKRPPSFATILHRPYCADSKGPIPLMSYFYAELCVKSLFQLLFHFDSLLAEMDLVS